MPSRHSSQSDYEPGVFPSSGEDSETFHRSSVSSPRNRKSSGLKSKHPSHSTKSRRCRYSSGYGSLDEESEPMQYSSGRSSVRSRKSEKAIDGLPALEYGDVPDYVQLPNLSGNSDVENSEFDERRSDWSVGSPRILSTVVEAPDGLNVTHLKTSGRDHLRHAPDMIFQGHRRVAYDRLLIRVNGEMTSYLTLPLHRNQECMDRLREEAKRHRLWRTDAVDKCRVMGTDVTAIFRYELVSMKGQRAIVTKTRPDRGQRLQRYCEPSPAYDYEVKVPRDYRECSTSIDIDNTERRTGCRNCHESGKVKCNHCCGSGHITCERCHGDGHEPMTHRDCYECNGGFRTCPTCRAALRVTCSECEGKGRLIEYKVLKVDWKVQVSVYQDELPGLPYKYIRKTPGKEVLSMEGCQVNPISDRDILHRKLRDFSRKELCRHSSGRAPVVKQRHHVEIIPVQTVDCCYKEKTAFHFYTFGLERNTYVPDFPKKWLPFSTRLFSR